MDSTVSPGSSDVANELRNDAELPVPVDTLAVDGIRPKQGDPVDFKVSGTVTRLVNETLYVRIENVNDQPLEKPVVQPPDEEARLRTLSEEFDRGGV